MKKMSNGRYGTHGGQYVPETLMNAVLELQKAYETYKKDPQFIKELQQLYHDYANRPSLLYYAERMTQDLGGAKIYLKREDLNHTGAHKINNALGQCLLAKKMGKSASLRKRAPVSTAWQPLRSLLYWALNVWSTWESWIRSVRPSTCIA